MTVNLTSHRDLSVTAKLIVLTGKPYTAGWSDEGTPESGPYGGTTYGFRLGRLHVYLSRNGSVILHQTFRRSRAKQDGIFHVVYSSSGFTRSTNDRLALLVRDALQALRAGKPTASFPTPSETSEVPNAE